MKRRSIIDFMGLFVFLGNLVLCGQQDNAGKPQRRPPNKALQTIVDDPKLPRVLLIGDSISIGYTLPVRKLLTGKANVHRPKTNCGPTSKGVAELDAWLGDSKWDVIHFNWGLHDLKYLGPNGENLADPKDPRSRQQVPIDKYEKNLRELVGRLKQTDAVLIWRSTTPVPEGAKGRVAGDSAKYNEVAAKVMKENDIYTDDMYGYTLPQLAKIQLKANVHFTKEGSAELAKHVASAVEAALTKRIRSD